MGNNHNEHHVIPFSLLSKVCVALLVLTAITVGAAQMHLGVWEAPVAFLIAFIKAMLVMAYFMGLKYDEKSNRIIFSVAFITLALMFAFCALDIWTRVAFTSTL